MAVGVYKSRFNMVWFLTLGITTLAASILIYIFLVESTFGAFSIQEANPSIITADAGQRVGIVQSQATEAYLQRSARAGDDMDWYSRDLDMLTGALTSEGYTNRRVRDFELEAMSDDEIRENFDVLIVAGAQALSDPMLRKLQTFAWNGGSLFVNQNTGTYDENGIWRGWNFIEETFGLQFVDFIRRGSGDFTTFRDTLFGTAPPGLYLPKPLDATPSDISDLPLNNGQTTGEITNPILEQLRRLPARSANNATVMQPLAEQTNVASLRGWTWRDSSKTPLNLPPTNHLQADTITVSTDWNGDGILERRPAMDVIYRTWVGGERDPNRMISQQNTSGFRRFTLRGNSPMNYNIPGGYRMRIGVFTPAAAMRVTEPVRTKVAGFWYDFESDDDVVDDALRNTAGLVYGQYGKGRFIYSVFSFDALRNIEDGYGYDEEDAIIFDQLMDNMFSWLHRRPVSWVSEWPSPYRAGASIIGIGGTQLDNFQYVKDVLDDEGVRGAYFIRPQSYTSMFNNYHTEANSLGGDVAVVGTLLRSEDGLLAQQEAQVTQNKNRLEDALQGSKPVAGYLSTQAGRFSNTTLQALANAGYTYFLPDSVGRRTVPKIMGFDLAKNLDFSSLVRLNKTARTDQEAFDAVPNGPLDLRASILVDDAKRTAYEGGLYILRYSSDLLAQPQNVGAFRQVINQLRNDEVWITSPEIISDWWRKRHGINVQSQLFGTERVVVRISNDNDMDVEEPIQIIVELGRELNPDFEIERDIRPETIGAFDSITGTDPDMEPIIEVRSDRTALILTIPKLTAKQYRTFHIDMGSPDPDERRPTSFWDAIWSKFGEVF